MSKIVVTLGLLVMAGCSADSVRCGMGAEQASELMKSSECPSCLLGEISEALKVCPTDEALLKLGMYGAIRSKQPVDALVFYEALRDSNKATTSQHADAALIYRSLGKGEEALRSFAEAVRMGADPMIEYEYAIQLRDAGRLSEARGILERIIESNFPIRESGQVQMIGSDAIYDDASIALAEIFVKEGSPERARSVYKRVLAAYPDHSEAVAGLQELETHRSRK